MVLKKDNSTTIFHSMFLSKRIADQTQIQEQVFADKNLPSLILQQSREIVKKYLIDTYKLSENQAEELLDTYLRTRAQCLATRKQGQAIVVPPTTESPHARSIPVAKPTKESSPALIDASPATSPQEKAQEVSEAVTDDQESRQQQLLNSIKAIKLVVADLSKAMYGVELTEENLGKVATKVIEAVSDLSAEQTADTVKNLASPLVGG